MNVIVVFLVQTHAESASFPKKHVFVRFRGHFPYQFFNSVLSAAAIHSGK